jgi:hypothetical protein
VVASCWLISVHTSTSPYPTPVALDVDALGVAVCVADVVCLAEVVCAAVAVAP